MAYFSSDIQGLSEEGLVCRRPKGDTYVASDDRWVLEFYTAHRNDAEEALIHAVMTNPDMWGRDLTEVPGFESEAARILRLIRREGALAAYGACL